MKNSLASWNDTIVKQTILDFLQAATDPASETFVTPVERIATVHNLPRAMIIGSSVAFQYGVDAQGVAQVLPTKELDQPIDNGPGKPVHIHRAIGRRPIMAAGNSNDPISATAALLVGLAALKDTH